MQSINQFLFDYGPVLEFRSNFSVGQSIERLESLMHKPSADFFNSRMVGVVREDNVRLHRKRAFMSTFLSAPIFTGRFTSIDGQVVLKGTMSVSSFTKLTMSLGLITLVAIELLLIPATMSADAVPVLKVITLFFVPAVAGLALGTHLVLKRLFNRDADWLVAKIRVALRGS